MRLLSIACSFLLLLRAASTEALPALDPCWRPCFTHELACKDGDWPCFCRKARRTDIFSRTITCIRETCTGNRPFNPTALLTPFTEDCQKPIPPDVLANANALAAQNTTSSEDLNSSGSLKDITANTATFRSAATSLSAKADVATTTFIGLAINANSQQETFIVPALVESTKTIYGSPVTGVKEKATPTSTITLPWPTLPVGYFFPQSGSGAVTNPTVEAATSLGPNIGVTTRTSVVVVETTGASTQEPGDAEGGGTVLEANQGSKQGRKSSLGLMVVLLIGVIWF
ncbi:MAG: hypothetical protein Q9213_005538 [Squamulea squamosa]